MTRPLDGIRVLSLAEQLPGPYATLILQDLGAEIIMIERPDGGDPVRQLPALFTSLARGKKSVVLDLKSEAGQHDFLALAELSDVVVEGFRPGTVARLGVDHDAVRRENPEIVYVSLSGFGQTGPLQGRPAHDIVYQGISGLLHNRIGRADPGPVSVLPLADMAAANFAIVAVLAGIVQRERHGEGAYFDVAMLDCLLSWMTPLLVPALAGNPPHLPPPYPGYGIYKTSDDKLLTLGVTHENHLWVDLCDALDLERIRHLEGAERLARHEELDEAVRARIAERTQQAWNERLAPASVAFGLVLDLDEVPSHPQVQARGAVRSDPRGRRGWATRQPLRADGDIADETKHEEWHVPLLGEHTDEVLQLLRERETP